MCRCIQEEVKDFFFQRYSIQIAHAQTCTVCDLCTECDADHCDWKWNGAILKMFMTFAHALLRGWFEWCDTWLKLTQLKLVYCCDIVSLYLMSVEFIAAL